MSSNPNKIARYRKIMMECLTTYFSSDEGKERLNDAVLTVFDDVDLTSKVPASSTASQPRPAAKSDSDQAEEMFDQEVEILLKYSDTDTPRWCLPGLKRAQTQQFLTFKRKARQELTFTEIGLMVNLRNRVVEAYKSTMNNLTLDDVVMRNNLITLYLAVFSDDQGLAIPGVTQDDHDTIEELATAWKSATLDDSDRDNLYLNLKYAFETQFQFGLTYAHAIKPAPPVSQTKKRPAASAPSTSQSAPKTRKRHVDITIQQEIVKYDLFLGKTMTSYANAHGGRKLEKWEIVQLVAHAAGYLRKHCRQGPKPQIISGFISQQQANHGVTDPAHLELIAKQPWDPKSEFALRTKGN
jgi:hypothetical protein